jgi:hypothetical protein
MSEALKLGTVLWGEGPSERRTLVASLPSDPSRVVDLNRVEYMRLLKLGEGHAEILAEALVPPSLRRVLEGGPRALQRVRQALAYAEKWASRGDLPESLAPRLDAVHRLPCLPRPALLRRFEGVHLDRLALKGPGGILNSLPQPTLALIGLAGGRVAGCCLALEDGPSTVLGGWLSLEIPARGNLELRSEAHQRRAPLSTWEGLEIPVIRTAEVVLLPPPRLRTLADLTAGSACAVMAPFDTLPLRLGDSVHHPTVQ